MLQTTAIATKPRAPARKKPGLLVIQGLKPRKEKFVAPKTASGWIKMAIEDVIALRKAKVNIDMGYWLNIDEPSMNGPVKASSCTACFAGAVMLRSIDNIPEADEFQSLGPYAEPFTKYGDKLRSLDFFRHGCIIDGLVQFHSRPREEVRIDIIKRIAKKAGTTTGDLSEAFYDFKVPEYSRRNHDAFVVAMRKMVRKLEKFGL